jgi:3-hydroxybutyryl-CoA dehydrogenase
MSELIAILGGGLMGRGIAQVFACAGHEVRITDPFAEVRASLLDRVAADIAAIGLDAQAARRIEVVETLQSCVADANFVIEAAPENLELKQQIFADVETAAPPTAILASNTSVIPIGRIMAKVLTKSRALGTHWWNPPYLVPLVEVIRAAETSDAAVGAALSLLQRVGKSPVEVKKDTPGFVGNRLQHALWREAIALIEEGVCEPETVDAVIKASFGARLAALGPIENADLIGIELTRSIHQYVLPALSRAQTPSPLLDKLIAEGRLGFKSGRGFLEWPLEAQTALRTKVTRQLKASFGSAREE